MERVDITTGPRPIVRMMVLETDKPHPETENRKGTFGEILHNHFADAGEAQDPPLGIETDVRFVVTERGGYVPKYDEFKECKALLITGSVYDAHGNEPWILELLEVLRKLWINRPDMHFSGVCFGHQLLCRLLGAKVAPAPSGDWELGHSEVFLNGAGKRLFRTQDKSIHLHQMHEDQVVVPPTPETSNGLLSSVNKVEVWGYSDHTAVQGVYIRGRLFTTQAHVAFDAGMVRRQIEMRVKSGSIDDLEHADEAAETAHLRHDGNVVATAILRFFYNDDQGVE